MAPPEQSQLGESEQLLCENINLGKTDEVKRLLAEPGVKADFLDSHGMTPLQHAAYKGNKELCELFLANGADVNSHEHDHGYTALMFAALSGNTEVTRLILESGARVNHENSVGRTAAQMAGFVGMHQCVSLINNFFSRDDLEYYCTPQGLEKDPKLLPELAPDLSNYILISNLNPVKLSLYLQQHPRLLEHAYSVAKVLELMCERQMKQRYTNEILAIKFHYMATMVRHCDKASHDKDGDLEPWLRSLLVERDGGCLESQEKLVRAMLKDFPYIECQLLQQLIRTLAPAKLGDDPTALSVLQGGINGQRFANDDDDPCSTCASLKAAKKCSACKMAHYCNQQCQKLHWFVHKKNCKKLAVLYVKIQEDKKKQEEEEKKKEEEKKQEEEKKKKLEEEEQKTKQEEEEKQKQNDANDSASETGLEQGDQSSSSKPEDASVCDKLPAPADDLPSGDQIGTNAKDSEP